MHADSQPSNPSIVLDDHLVITAELEGMRRLARLDRPRVDVVHEDLPGASCHWRRAEGDRDLVRLRPGRDVDLADTLQAIQTSTVRHPGRHLEIRGAASSFDNALGLLERLGGRRNTELPRELMARDLTAASDDLALPHPAFTTLVASDEASVRQLRRVVGEAFGGGTDDDEPDLDADFFHAPQVMTYLAVRDGETVISAGSLLIVDAVANVWSIATTASARGQGAATAIMRAVCVEARHQGAHAAVLRTTPDLAAPGGLYARVGFTHVGHEHIWELDDVDALAIS